MVVMDESLLSKYQDEINFTNADNMFIAFDGLINRYGRDFILQTEHDSELDCVRSYTARAHAIKCATDVIEHYTKAILIKQGHTWDESKSWGHSLLDLYQNLDDDCKDLIKNALLYFNDVQLPKDDNINSNIIKDYPLDKDETLIKLIRLIEKYDLSYKNIIENIIENDHIYNNNLKICSNKYYPNLKVVKSEPPKNIRVIPLKDGQTIESELEKTKPVTRRDQHLGIKARFPGEKLIEGNAEFLISLAYAMRDISLKIRKENVPKY